MKDVKKKKLASGNHLTDEASYKPDPPARGSQAQKLAAAEVKKLLANRITDEAILLAANVLSVQNPQGAGFDRKKLLADAYQLALEAREVCTTTPIIASIERNKLKLASAMLGYGNYNSFVPFEEAAFRMTGLKTKKQAIKRFERFIEHTPPFNALLQEIRERGIAESLIELFSAWEKEYHGRMIRVQNQKNARRPRKKSYRNPKKSP